MNKKIIKYCGLFFFLNLTLVFSAFAQTDEVYRVKFAKGKSSKTFSYAVLRDEVIVYKFKAKSGQRLSVRISALEKNAAFTIQSPNGKFLRGAGEMDDQTIWNGKITESGEYEITVGSTRGNADYRLTVSIR